MSIPNNSPAPANLTLSNRDGLTNLLDKVDVATRNIYSRRKDTVKYFKEELFVAKTKTEYFAQISLNENDNMIFTPKLQQPNNGNAFGNLSFDNGHHVVTEYNNRIRYQFKTAISNLKNAERALKLAIKYDGSVELSADILNNLDFFSNNPECVSKLNKYCKKQVDEFISQHTPNEPEAG
jgi:hypothetical protein